MKTVCLLALLVSVPVFAQVAQVAQKFEKETIAVRVASEDGSKVAQVVLPATSSAKAVEILGANHVVLVRTDAEMTATIEIYRDEPENGLVLIGKHTSEQVEIGVHSGMKVEDLRTKELFAVSAGHVPAVQTIANEVTIKASGDRFSSVAGTPDSILSSATGVYADLGIQNDLNTAVIAKLDLDQIPARSGAFMRIAELQQPISEMVIRMDPERQLKEFYAKLKDPSTMDQFQVVIEMLRKVKTQSLVYRILSDLPPELRAQVIEKMVSDAAKTREADSKQ